MESQSLKMDELLAGTRTNKLRDIIEHKMKSKLDLFEFMNRSKWFELT
jgi:hypothetical protein